jgi:hypothetical protein
MKTAITIKKTYETVANERADVCARELGYTDTMKDAFIESFVDGYALGKRHGDQRAVFSASGGWNI